jgi:branched-chain amino acid aminotransferase
VNGGTKIFKAVEHFDRLEQSALAINMLIIGQLHTIDLNATYEVLKRNNLQDAYNKTVYMHRLI